MKTIIHNGRLISGDDIIYNGYLALDGGVIKEIGVGKIVDKKSVSQAEEIVRWIDAEGNYICPGFIDLHVHGVGICDIYKDTSKGLKNMSRILASHGVTSFLPTLVTAPLDIIMGTLSIIKGITVKTGAAIVGVNLEGPYINLDKKGAHPAKDIRKPDKNEIIRIINSGGGLLRIMTMAPELLGARECFDILKANGVIPAIGHTLASFEETMSAIDYGFTYISHTFNAMTPFHHRAPGAIGAVLMRKEVTTEIIADGIHVHPEVVKFLCQLKENAKMVLVTDALVGIMRKGDKAEFAGDEAICDGFGAYNNTGMLMGSTVSMNRSILNIMKFTGMSMTSAIKLATINPANVLGVGYRKGTLEVGKDADIVIISEDFGVKTTIVGGEAV